MTEKHFKKCVRKIEIFKKSFDKYFYLNKIFIKKHFR